MGSITGIGNCQHFPHPPSVLMRIENRKKISLGNLLPHSLAIHKTILILMFGNRNPLCSLNSNKILPRRRDDGISQSDCNT